MRTAAKDCGLVVDYHVDEEKPTGTCAVLVVGAERSLIANLAAANHYKYDHLLSIEKTMKEANFYYSAGYFLTVSPESMIHLGKHAAETDKIFMTNFAATFICQFYLDKLLSVLPYADYVFANKDEVLAFAQAMKYETEDVKEIAKKVSLMDKVNTKRERIVVFTQGSDPVVVAINGKVQTFDVPELDQKLIVDMNGAGDAFCGGFISQLVDDKPLKDCVAAGNYAAQTILLHSGCTYPEKPSFKN
jgi:adenosine kinase